ncbi:alpha/beta fold hydrolase [Microbacterium sp. LWH3-1.2]|uniref:alpha/beta fold hydrolase n=1 Tax=Microbacterium sp. LWH3-1.2 TaxID=3135256 RepID=UPI0034284542
MDRSTSRVVDTAHGAIECIDAGEGQPVLFVHGSPGGADQGALMGAFLLDAGFRVIAPARPGYGRTPLTKENRTPAAQAVLHVDLMDALGLERASVVCWSGGGPSTYSLATTHSARVDRVVAIAAVSGDFRFTGITESRLMAGSSGRWVMDQLVHHAPKSVVRSLAKEEGHLDRSHLAALVDHIWNDPATRSFALELARSVTGSQRKAGLKNDQTTFPEIVDLRLAEVTAPTLLVHGTADADVPFDQSERARGSIPGAVLLPIADGTHIAAWTDPTSENVQGRIIAHLRGASRTN